MMYFMHGAGLIKFVPSLNDTDNMIKVKTFNLVIFPKTLPGYSLSSKCTVNLTSLPDYIPDVNLVEDSMYVNATTKIIIIC